LRLERNFKGEYFTAFRNVSKFGDLTASVVGIISLDKFNLTKYDGLLNYKLGDVSLSLQHNSNDSFTEYRVGKVQAGASFKYNKDLSLSVKAVSTQDKQSQAQKYRFVAGVESRVNDDLSVKAKVDQKGKVTSSLQYTLDNRVSFLTTVQVNNPNKPLDLKKIIPLPLGYQISINV